ncbi:MAG: hypothetical protein V7K67_33690 [Nostoc sp.]|uniref:hypothetical protein n=1 Tax=Nostoc sp. TaxID=1180 RepID=UPI002FF7C6E3
MGTDTASLHAAWCFGVLGSILSRPAFWLRRGIGQYRQYLCQNKGKYLPIGVNFS